MDDDERRSEIFSLIGALGVYWMQHPELRLGQSLANFTSGTEDQSRFTTLYNTTDEQWLRMLRPKS